MQLTDEQIAKADYNSLKEISTMLDQEQRINREQRLKVNGRITEIEQDALKRRPPNPKGVAVIGKK